MLLRETVTPYKINKRHPPRIPLSSLPRPPIPSLPSLSYPFLTLPSVTLLSLSHHPDPFAPSYPTHPIPSNPLPSLPPLPHPPMLGFTQCICCTTREETPCLLSVFNPLCKPHFLPQWIQVRDPDLLTDLSRHQHAVVAVDHLHMDREWRGRNEMAGRREGVKGVRGRRRNERGEKGERKERWKGEKKRGGERDKNSKRETEQ